MCSEAAHSTFEVLGLPRLNFYTVCQAWGNDVSTWTTDNITYAGSIIGGLSVTEISNLYLSSNDVIEAISGYDVYSNPQVHVYIQVLYMYMYTRCTDQPCFECCLHACVSSYPPHAALMHTVIFAVSLRITVVSWALFQGLLCPCHTHAVVFCCLSWKLVSTTTWSGCTTWTVRRCRPLT